MSVTVNLYQTATLKRLLGRPQRWRWRAAAGNGEVLASGESYVNRADCLAAVDQLFRSGEVWLREPERGTTLLRKATPQP